MNRSYGSPMALRRAVTERLRRLAQPHGPWLGVTFHIGRIELVANTGTYLDSPYHRFVLVPADGPRIDAPTFGGSTWTIAPCSCTPAGAGTGAPRIRRGRRPAHTVLLRAGVPVLEHLCNLDRLPGTGFTLHAAPIAIRGLGTFPVRAYAVLPD